MTGPNLEGIFSTRKAAEKAGMKRDELIKAARGAGITVPKVGSAFLWTEEIVKRVVAIETARAKGVCPHCGKSLTAAPAEEKPAE